MGRRILMNRCIVVFILVVLVLSSLLACQTSPSPSAPTPTTTTKPSATAPATSAPTATPKTIVWRIASYDVSKPFSKAVEWWGEEMARRTNGRIKAEWYWGATLFAAKDTPESLRDGLADMALTNATYHPTKTPIEDGVALPFISPASSDAIGYWFDYIIKHPVPSSYLKKTWNVSVPMMYVILPYQIFSKKPVRNVGDFNGLRIRIPAATGDYLAKYGAVPIMTTGAEIYSSVQKGIVDAVAVPIGSASTYDLQSLCSYTIMIDLLNTLGMVMVSDKAWQGLPDDVKKAAADISDTYIQKAVQYVEETAVDGRKIFAQRTEVTTFPASERAKLVTGAAGLYGKWVTDTNTKYGVTGAEGFLNDIRKKADELNAKYPMK